MSVTDANNPNSFLKRQTHLNYELYLKSTSDKLEMAFNP